MSLAAGLVGRIDRDLALTRRLLEQVPDGQMAWQPHPRSFSLGELATHLARLPHWGAQILQRPSHDLASRRPQRPPEATRTAVIAVFDRHRDEFLHALRSTSDGDLTSPWTLRRAEVVVETLPRIEAVERYMLHHLIHHRGQLTVYFRLRDIPLLPLYGPTADRSLA